MVSKAVVRSALATDGAGSVQDASRFLTEGIRLGDTFSQTVDIPGEPGPFPDNEPSGFTMVTHVDCSSKIFTSGGTWFRNDDWNDPNRVVVVNDPESKFGTAIEKRFFVGDTSGWNGITSLPASQFPGEFNEFYQRKVFKLSDNWQKHSAGEKYLFFGVVVQSPTGSDLIPAVTFGQYVFPDGELTPSYPFWLPILPGSPDLSDVGGNILKGTEHVARLVRGQYHTVEVIQRSATGPDPTDRDGYIRYWFDGQECTRWTAFGAGPRSDELRDVPLNAIHDIEDPQTFPGGGSAENILHWGGQADTKNRDDWVRMSEYYVSVRN